MDTCALPTPTPEALAMLQGVKSIAVVGLSPNQERPSHRISTFLITRGYSIIPIRPATYEVLGIQAYPSLLKYGKAVDMVLIFRRSEAVPEIVEQALQIGTRVIWMQEGICHDEAAAKARAAGINVVQNKCILRVLEA